MHFLSTVMIKRLYLLILLLDLLVLEAEGRRIVYPQRYPFVIYKFQEGRLYPEWRSRRKEFPFPVGIFYSPRGLTLWIKQKEGQGLLSPTSHLVVLSPYLDFHPEVDYRDEYNWLRYLFEELAIDKAFVIFPPDIRKEHPEWFQGHSELTEEVRRQGFDLNLLDDIKNLPDSSHLRDVILVVDLAYFADKLFLNSLEYEDLIMRIIDFLRILERKKLRIKAFLILFPSQFVDTERAEPLLEQLLELLSTGD